MKNSFILYLCLVLIVSCSENKKEETKPSIDPKIQNTLNEIENNWLELAGDFDIWQKKFIDEKKAWMKKRPVDSVEHMARTTGFGSERLQSDFNHSIESYRNAPMEIEKWNEANLKTIASFNTEADNFSKWKKDAESGKFNAKQISEAIAYQKSTLESGRMFLEDMKSRWETMKFHDNEMTKSFRTIF